MLHSMAINELLLHNYYGFCVQLNNLRFINKNSQLSLAVSLETCLVDGFYSEISLF